MRRVRAPQDLVAVSDVPVVRLGDHLRVRVLRLPVERARGGRDVDEHLAAVHQRMIVAERGKAELAGCFHGELSYPERQRPDATPASGVMDEPGEEVTHRAEPIRPGEEL